MMSRRFQTFTKDGESIVVEAYGTSDICSYVRSGAQLTNKLLKVSLAAVSIACFFESLEVDEGNTESICANSSVRSDLFNGGSTVLVSLTPRAFANISCNSFPKSSTIFIPWSAMITDVADSDLLKIWWQRMRWRGLVVDATCLC